MPNKSGMFTSYKEAIVYLGIAAGIGGLAVYLIVSVIKAFI